LQQSLVQRGYPVPVNGDFDSGTYQAVRAFQSQNLDQHGQSLVVDGKVGPLTWWSLTHSKPDLPPVSAIDYTQMPAAELGGSTIGRSALAAAIGEIQAGAGEIGGNNLGPFVEKYLKPAGLMPPESWCASFASWCYLQACGGNASQMPFPYCPGARALLKEFQDKWISSSDSGTLWIPSPDDSRQGGTPSRQNVSRSCELTAAFHLAVTAALRILPQDSYRKIRASKSPVG
jgi:hypothetical protein